MRYFLALLLILFSQAAEARGGGSAQPACTASPPAQASAVGLTHLVFCDNFTTNQSIDVNNTLNPGFQWYVQHYNPHADHVSPNQLQNDGTGTWLSGNNNGKSSVLFGAAQLGSTQTYVGQGFTGAFYAECSRKLNPQTTTGEPSMWFASIGELLHPGVTSGNPPYPYVEIDVGDWPSGSGPYFAVWDWKDTLAAGDAYGNTNQTPTVSATWTNYNTFGVLFVPASANSGTGYFKFYVNDAHVASDVTYTQSGPPTPSTCVYQYNYGSPVTCPNGNYYSADSETFFMMLGTDIGGTAPYNSLTNHTIQWCHVWQ